ncbi:hypothetical protein BC835DRAFT_576712 [Cytidiella melzeri]|nr:hypothetical protein BC835DRAFT_576712 [Cytidiella melzeri]
MQRPTFRLFFQAALVDSAMYASSYISCYARWNLRVLAYRHATNCVPSDARASNGPADTEMCVQRRCMVRRGVAFRLTLIHAAHIPPGGWSNVLASCFASSKHCSQVCGDGFPERLGALFSDTKRAYLLFLGGRPRGSAITCRDCVQDDTWISRKCRRGCGWPR